MHASFGWWKQFGWKKIVPARFLFIYFSSNRATICRKNRNSCRVFSVRQLTPDQSTWIYIYSSTVERKNILDTLNSNHLMSISASFFCDSKCKCLTCVTFTNSLNPVWWCSKYISSSLAFSAVQPLMLLLAPSRSDKTWLLPLFFPCLLFKHKNSRRTPLSTSTENFHIIDYKWDNKSQHHFKDSWVKITRLHLHVVL